MVWGQVSNLPCGLMYVRIMYVRIWRKTGVLACNDWEGIGSIIINGPRLEFQNRKLIKSIQTERQFPRVSVLYIDRCGIYGYRCEFLAIAGAFSRSLRGQDAHCRRKCRSNTICEFDARNVTVSLPVLQRVGLVREIGTKHIDERKVLCRQVLELLVIACLPGFPDRFFDRHHGFSAWVSSGLGRGGL